MHLHLTFPIPGPDAAASPAWTIKEAPENQRAALRPSTGSLPASVATRSSSHTSNGFQVNSSP